MNKVYLLLRNNNIMGPFSIDELLQQHLKSTDLIWIEGRSVAWCFPSQIRELNNDFQKILSSIDNQQTSADKPSGQPTQLSEISFEERVEAIRKKALAYTYQPQVVKPLRQENFLNPQYITKEPAHVVYHSSRRYVTLSQLVASGALTALVAWAWYSGWSPVNPKVASEQAAVVPVNMVSVQSNAAKRELPADTMNTIAVIDSTPLKAHLAAINRKPSEAIDTGNNNGHPTHNITSNEAVGTEITLAPAAEPVQKGSSVETTTKTPESVDARAEEAKEVSGDDAEKKKSFGQVIKGIFKKKKKDKEDDSASER